MPLHDCSRCFHEPTGRPNRPTAKTNSCEVQLQVQDNTTCSLNRLPLRAAAVAWRRESLILAAGRLRKNKVGDWLGQTLGSRGLEVSARLTLWTWRRIQALRLISEHSPFW
jgi:hypothetical protein